MIKFNSNYAAERASEMTKLAIEHGLIPSGDTPSETGKNIVEVFSSIFDGLTSDTN